MHPPVNTAQTYRDKEVEHTLCSLASKKLLKNVEYTLLDICRNKLLSVMPFLLVVCHGCLSCSMGFAYNGCS